MSDPILHSSSWTGEPTYTAGASSAAIDYERIVRARAELERAPPEVRRVWRLAAFALLSPVALWMAYLFCRAAIPDAFGQDHSELLTSWGLLTVFAAAWQLTSKSGRFLLLRRAGLAALLVATVGGAFIYAYAAMASHAQAIPSVQERTFEIYQCHGRCRFGGYYVHQRADGTTVEGENVGAALPYHTTCTAVQRLTGYYGFSWVRVIERSQPSQRGILWPIRREECFGTKPVSSLKG